MSLNSSRHPPTTPHHVDSGSQDSSAVLSSSRAWNSSRSSTSTAASYWIDDVPSRSSSPSPSQRVIPLPPPWAATQPPRLLSPNPGHGIPLLAFPTHAGTNHYPPTPPPTSYAFPPASDLGPGSFSSRRSASSAHTRSSTRDRPERDGHSKRPIEIIPCQICLEPATVCRCKGGKKARRKTREAAQEVFNRTEGAIDPRPNARSQESQVAPQTGGPGYGQGFEYMAGHRAPMAYAGSPIPVYSGQPVVMGGCTSGYYGSPVLVPTSQTWIDEQQGLSGLV